jgi:3-phenylpropionate/trans-cinnamate dioxygenase ferredoxin subunit
MSMYDYTRVDESKIEYIEIAPVSELAMGERLFVEIGGKPIVIFQIGGQYYSIGDVCSHDEGPVGEGQLTDHTITCPRHGAQFDVRNGKVVTMPAVVDIPAYPVQIRDGMIYLGIPKE